MATGRWPAFLEMKTKKITLLFLILYIMNFLFVCSTIQCLSKKTLIQEEVVIISKKYIIQSYITNAISDPTYARLYINNNEIFRCRGASKIVFTIENDILTIYTDGNLKYEYDRIQKKCYGELQIIYLEM